MLRGERVLPVDYRYPSLPRRLMLGAAHLCLSWKWIAGGAADRTAVAEPAVTFYANYDPPAILLASRWVAFLASLGLVVLLAFLVRTVAGEGAGLAAAWLAAWCPALVVRSGSATVDPLAALFALAALWAVERAVRSPDRRGAWSLLAGAACGCALTSKYPAAIVAVPALYRLLADRPSPRRAARAVIRFALGALAAVAVTMPETWLDTRRVLHAVLGQESIYSHQASRAGYWSQLVTRAEWDLPYHGPELGWVLGLLVVAGALLCVGTRRLRAPGLAWSSFVLLLASFYSTFEFQAFRNLLPAVPAALALAGAGGAALPRRFRASGWTPAVVVVLPVLLFGPPLLAHARVRARLVDSRVEAVDWLRSHLRAEDGIWVDPGAGILRSELARLPVRAVSTASPSRVRRALERRRFRYAVVPQRTSRSSARRGPFGAAAGAGYRLVAQFGERPGAASPEVYRGNRPRVLVLETARGGGSVTLEPGLVWPRRRSPPASRQGRTP